MPTNLVPLNSEFQKLSQDSAWVELYTLDATKLGGTLFTFCNHVMPSGEPVKFGGVIYAPIPISITGWDMTQTGTTAKPEVSVSNISKVLHAAVVAQGDLVGAKLSRVRTFSKYLDEGATPNPNAFVGPDVMYIEQKTRHDREIIQFQLTSALDRMGMKLPRRQILKDENYLGCHFPGVARNRVR